MTTKITRTQNAYLLRLHEAGAQTSNELMQHFGVVRNAATRPIKVLRDAGLVRSTLPAGGGRRHRTHELTAPYPELDISISTDQRGNVENILDEEFEHIATLRKEGRTGSELAEAHQRKYPHRTNASVKNMVRVARGKGLCR